jgi:hypothetical protein
MTDVSDLGSGRKKRAHAKEVREKSILTLYNKLHELVSLLAELLNIQVLTDTAVLHASSMGVAPFFVESVSELQLSALKLVTTVSYFGLSKNVCISKFLPLSEKIYFLLALFLAQQCSTFLTCIRVYTVNSIIHSNDWDKLYG